MLSLTELSQKTADLAEMRSGPLGRCSHFFWLGVAFDAVGVAVLFTGVFANLLFYDMLLYLGSIIIFVSLLWWISWYTGNIEALPEDPLRGTSHRDGGVHRSGSHRFSLTLRSVSNTFQRIRRRRRRRLHPRVVQRISSISSTDPSQLERNRDARTAGGRALLRPGKPGSFLNQFSGVQASKSLPLVLAHTPLSVCTSRSQPVFSVTSQSYPLASDSNSQMALSSDSPVPVDSPHPQQRSKISVTSQSYPLERTESQSHLLVPMTSDSFSMISQSHLQSSDSYVSVPLHRHFQECSRITVASQSYPLQRVESQSHLLALSDGLSMVPLTSQSQIRPSVSSESYVSVDPYFQGRSKISMASRIYPLERTESQSHLLVPVPSDRFPMIPMTSQSQIQPSVSSESCVPVDPHSQGRSKISVTSQIYPLERRESQSHLLVPMPSDSFPMVPMTSQSQIQGSLDQQSDLQNLPTASQTPETDKTSKSHTLAKGVPVVPPGSAQTQHPQASLTHTSQRPSSVQKGPKN